jgi:hemolysin-activating ACP:hemolysin acyltransferase
MDPASSPSLAASATPTFDLVRDRNPHAAFGKAVMIAMRQPVFARLPFGQIATILAGQINRDHYFLVTRDGRITGFLGWAYTTPEGGERWLVEDDTSLIGDGRAGDTVVLNVWISDGADMTAFSMRHLRRLWSDKRQLLARRIYPDGTVRPVRLTNARRPAHGAGADLVHST